MSETNEKRGKGRPTKLTKEIQDTICKAIRAGAYIETASALAGLDKTTFYDWLRRGEREQEGIYFDFSHSIKKAIAEAEMRDILRIDQAAQENWTASAWRLERRFPQRWGKKDKLSADIEHSGSITNKEETSITIKQQITTDEESKELLKQLWRRKQALQGEE